jgi:hypothetical protein
MSVSGLCQVCQSAQAAEQCSRCGALVCRTHFERSVGCCAECAGGSEQPGTYRF